MKLNEKGFAISTILYGILLVAVMVIALLMSTAAFNRKTTVDFVKSVEEELNQTADAYIPSGTITKTINSQFEKWEAPKTGYYRITLCARGGDCTSGAIYLVVRQKLYFFKPTNGAVDVRLTSSSESYSDYSVSNSRNSIIMSASTSSGSSYISGHPGMKSPTSKTSDSIRSGAEQTLHYSGRYFIDTEIINGSSKTYANITFLNNIVNIESFREPNLANVRFVKDCIWSEPGNNSWAEIYVMSNGMNIAAGRALSAEGAVYNSEELTYLTNNDKTDYKVLNKATCITVDVGRNMTGNGYYNIDAVGVYHDQNSQHDISVSDNGTDFYPAPQPIAIGNGQGSITKAFRFEKDPNFN